MAGINISVDGVSNEDDGEEAAPKKKGRGKLIIFALIGLLVLGGAGGAAFVFLAGSDGEVVAEDEPPVIEKPRELTYIDLEPIFIQVATGKGVLQNLVVELALEVELGNADVIRVRAEMPRLYEAYLRSLTDRPLPGADSGDIEPTHIKNRIRAENLRLLGPGVVYDVVLKNMWVTEG
jgi:flagellar basal body-associated protein FliL